MTLFTADFAEPLQRHRDIVLFDQRGVGLSHPALDCGELDLITPGDFADAATDPYLDAFADCRNRFLADGVDIDAYNSAESAKDIADLAAALDYDQYNVYGVSYGTRLALTAMRDEPQHIRSVVLDSVLPLQGNVYADPTYEEALEELFRACSADATCRSVAPDLRGSFFSIVRDFDNQPAIVDTPRGGQFEVSGDDFLGFIFNAMYDTSYIPYLPADIVRIADGDTSPLGYLVRYAYYDLGTSLGLYLSVQCSEEVPFNGLEQVQASSHIDRIAEFTRQDVLARQADCRTWNVRKGPPAENEPVRSDLPTLILSGEFDPITPPSYARAAASTLSHGRVFTFPGYGHGVLDEGCSMSIMAAFLNAPDAEPDTTCISNLHAEFFGN
jgi:pimeloyl-ACP methyl ester carboxylesterase